MANARFIRKKEDFKCKKCGFEVKGNGFTNHCPKCLFSKHVDINPGDRMSECKGIMKPIKILKEGENLILINKCEKCGYEKRNKTAENDDFEKIVEVMKMANNKK